MRPSNNCCARAWWAHDRARPEATQAARILAVILLATARPVSAAASSAGEALIEAVLLGTGSPRPADIVRVLVAAGASLRIAHREAVRPLEQAHWRRCRDIARILEAAEAKRAP